MTQRLKRLEQKLGTSLFARSRRGMLLTPEGETLLRYCQSSKILEQTTLQQLNATGVTSTVRLSIAGPTSVLQGRVVDSVKKLIKRYPAVLISLHYQDEEGLVQRLKDGKAQLGVLAKEMVSQEMNTKELVPEEYILVGPKKWKGRKLKDIIQQERIIDFYESDTMTFTYLRHFNLLEKANSDRFFANHPEAIARLIKEGCGYSVLERSFAEPYIKKGELVMLNQGKRYTNPISLAWFDRPEMPGYFADMINFIN